MANILEQFTQNPSALNAYKRLLNTYALSGNPIGLGLNLTANLGFMAFGGAIGDDKIGKFLISTSILSSLALVYAYSAPVTLTTLAAYLMTDSTIRGCLGQGIMGEDYDIFYSEAMTVAANYTWFNGVVAGLLNGVILASSVLAIAQVSSVALPLAVGLRLMKAVTAYWESEKSNDSINRSKKHSYRFRMQALSEIASIFILCSVDAINPIPSFTVALYYTLADGFAKTFFDCAGIKGDNEPVPW